MVFVPSDELTMVGAAVVATILVAVHLHMVWTKGLATTFPDIFHSTCIEVARTQVTGDISLLITAIHFTGFPWDDVKLSASNNRTNRVGPVSDLNLRLICVIFGVLGLLGYFIHF